MLTANLKLSEKPILIDEELIGKLMDFYLRLAPAQLRTSDLIRRCVYQADRLNDAVKHEVDAEIERVRALQDKKYQEYLEEKENDYA